MKEGKQRLSLFCFPSFAFLSLEAGLAMAPLNDFSTFRAYIAFSHGESSFSLVESGWKVTAISPILPERAA